MDRYTAMRTIAAHIDHPIVVAVSHRGNWNGVHRYRIHPSGEIEELGHFWGMFGTLKSAYREHVVNKKSRRIS